MSGTTGISTTSPTACWVDAAGIHAPTYSAILAYLVSQYELIYGSDCQLDPDDQDYQWLAIQASAINDANNATIAAYSNYSPQTAQGIGLSNAVKINGLTRNTPSNSTVPVLITGSQGTVIPAGIITDSNNNQWTLPANVEIPSGGSITVTATAVAQGSIAAAPQTFEIATPIRNWQSAVSSTAAVPGLPVELDGALRIRQASSTAPAQQGVTQALIGQLEALPDVGRLNVIDNDTNTTIDSVIPPYNLAVVIEGGTSAGIAALILAYKAPGSPTYGSIEVAGTDQFGNAQNVYYSAPTEVTITVAITVLASTIPGGGYTTIIGNQIAAAVAAYIAALPIGQPVYLNRLMLPANLNGGVGSSTYDVVSIEISRTGTGGLSASNITLAWNEAPVCAASNVSITAT